MHNVCVSQVYKYTVSTLSLSLSIGMTSLYTAIRVLNQTPGSGHSELLKVFVLPAFFDGAPHPILFDICVQH